MPVEKVTPEEFLGGNSVIYFGNPMGHPSKSASKRLIDDSTTRKKAKREPKG